MKPADEESRKQPEEPLHTSLTPHIPTEQGMASNTHDPYRALRYRDFRFLITGGFIASVGDQMVSVAIGWELYERTGSALVLGGVGLVQVIPVMLLALPAGHLADRLSRKLLVIVAQLVLALASLGLMALSLTRGSIILIYACLLLMGCAVAFNTPASTTLLPQTVPERDFENAATWESGSWQLANVLGPALGGFVIALLSSAAFVYAANAGAALVFIILLLMLRGTPQRRDAMYRIQPGETTTLGSLLEGVRFLKSTQIILAAITLDMFAVLLGGATALLPIYARDILHVGPTGLGWLRAAPSIGAVAISIAIAHAQPFKKAGRTLLWSVAGFGVATIIFGVSRSFWLSLVMLAILGGLDSISVVIRSTLVLTRTPDALRGRIAAIDSIFVGTSNELGSFESGLAAQLFGPVIAVAGGGVGTVLVVLCVALLWPQMRRLGSLS
jgi:MFS family permease